VEVPGLGEVPISIVDASNPYVFVRASDLGLEGAETEEGRMGPECVHKIEVLRGLGAVLLGLVSSPEEAREKSPQLPKIAFVRTPETYRTTSGKEVRSKDVDVVARMMSMGSLHSAYAVTGAICTAGASRIEGTVVREMLGEEALDRNDVRIGHPAGILSIGVDMHIRDGSYTYIEASLYRTARRLMAGRVYVPERCFR
jgi:2-methylaconitate cis-trans-isomerase PrpF